jgi:nicotinamide-nucleotide amidase
VGFEFDLQRCHFLVTPGIPKEFDGMIDNALIAPLKATRQPYLKRTLYCFGLAEAEVDKRIQEFATRWPQIRLGFRVKFPETHVSLRAEPGEEDMLEGAFAFARQQLGQAVFDTEGHAFAEIVIDLLKQRQCTLAVAESCTGGLVSDLLTNVPGAGDVLLLDVVAYGSSAKTRVLGVKQETLDKHGAVSEQTAIEMAHNVRLKVEATYGVSTTGIAGPGGGTVDKPVGTIWTAVCGANDLRKTHKLSSPFDRIGNKTLAAYSVLEQLRRLLLAQ